MNEYLVTSLPALPEPGGAPPLSPAGFLERLASSPRAREAASLVLLERDLRLRDAWRAGERGHPEPAVLTPAQVRAEAPLAEELAVEPGDRSPRDAADAVWAAYFRHAAARAEALPSPLLAAWLRHEVGLRAALARERSQVFGLEATSPAAELADEAPALQALVGSWSQAPNPLAALRVLDTARLEWVARHEPWFSFSDDELVAWAMRLAILLRWRHLGEAAWRQAGAAPLQGARA